MNLNLKQKNLSKELNHTSISFIKDSFYQGVICMRVIPKHEKLFVGQERVVEKFLLFPKKLGKEIRWLERAKIKQKVFQVDVGGSMEWGNYKNMWRNVEWVN
jgi:hypothetical protein